MSAAIICISTVIFCALILNLAAKPKFTRGLAGVCTFLAAVGGLGLYGYGFSYTMDTKVLAVIRTLFAVCRMYAGVNDLGAVSGAPLYQHPLTIVIFWVVHFMAFYATASATISTVGAAALKKLRFFLQHYGSTVIIYGTNTDTVEFGRSIMEHGVHGILYVSGKCDPAAEAAINGMGCIYRSDASALNPDAAFLKSIGAHKGAPHIVLYAMELDDSRNSVYARKLLAALQEAGVDPQNTRLIMRSTQDPVESHLAATDGEYGFGDVKMVTDVALTARMLMQSMPPARKMSFDEKGRAKVDFDCIVVGFGRSGSEVLRQLVRSAQFEGSTFHAAVFTPDSAKENGYFCSSYPALMDQYDINFYSDDARSKAFYDYLLEHRHTLRYLVVCTGNEVKDRELWHNISSFLLRIDCDSAICRCSSRSVAWSATAAEPVEVNSIYASDRIWSDRCDRMAMELNYTYVNDPKVTAKEAWKSCDTFSRESSRASADAVDTFLAMSGLSETDVLAGRWSELDPEILENMGRTEHLRWCAFHYTMGFCPMSMDTVRERGEIYRQQTEKGVKALRITKDMVRREHACLCSWEELDMLADMEAEYKGSRTDYKDMDIRNVLALPAVWKRAMEAEA